MKTETIKFIHYLKNRGYSSLSPLIALAAEYFNTTEDSKVLEEKIKDMFFDLVNSSGRKSELRTFNTLTTKVPLKPIAAALIILFDSEIEETYT